VRAWWNELIAVHLHLILRSAPQARVSKGGQPHGQSDNEPSQLLPTLRDSRWRGFLRVRSEDYDFASPALTSSGLTSLKYFSAQAR